LRLSDSARVCSFEEPGGIRWAAVGRSGVENLRDVRMIHQRERLPLRLEARDDLPAVHAQFDDFEGDAAFDRLALLGHPDFAETTFADFLQ